MAERTAQLRETAIRQMIMRDFKHVPIERIVTFYERMFPFVRAHHELTVKAVRFGQTCEPPVDRYYWDHLPRLVHTVGLFLAYALRAGGPVHLRVLDAGTFPAMAGFWRLATADALPQGIDWVHTMLTPCHVHLCSGLGDASFECMGHDLNAEDLPCPGPAYDAVILAEVIEHLSVHPQQVFGRVSNVLKSGGLLLMTTPNVTSWKKIRSAIDGSWSYDSPTFGGEWGHRYEFSCYQVRHALMNTGFHILREETRDVNRDDPRGIRSWIEFGAIVSIRLLLGQWRSAAKLVWRKGSGTFIIAEKAGTPSGVTIRI